MDSALQLKMDIDNGEIFSEDEILEKLQESGLVKELTSDLPKKPLPLVWRLIGLSEIPFASLLEYTQRLIGNIYERFSTPFGFSLSGDEKQFYKSEGYIAFDKGRGVSGWATYIIRQSL